MDVFTELKALELRGMRDVFFIQGAAIGLNTFSKLRPQEIIKILRPIEDYFEYRNEFKENRKKVTDVIDAYVQTLR